MDSIYESEEAFLSVYTAEKLEQGGAPVITKQELRLVLNDFLKSPYGRSDVGNISKFKFDDLEKLAKNFQAKASKNRSWLKPCFVYKNEKLYPTYAFYDYTRTVYGEFVSYLWGEIPKTPLVPTKVNNCDPSIKKGATLAAKYITKHFAKEYINKEVKNGRWPRHLAKISYIFEKDLGSTLELEGTKVYFEKFYAHVQGLIINMLIAKGGKLKLSNMRDGDLSYNNLKRILINFPIFDELCPKYDEEQSTNFDMEIVGENVKVNEQTLIEESGIDYSAAYDRKEYNL